MITTQSFLPGTITLEERWYTIEEWDEGIIPMVERGELEDISSEMGPGSLVWGQTMQALVKDRNGCKWYCSGWSCRHDHEIPESKWKTGPNVEQHVKIRKWKGD